MSSPDKRAETSQGVAETPVDSPGPTLLLSQGDNRLSDLRVTEYRLDVDGGIPSGEDPSSFTQAARWAFSNYHGIPLASNGSLRLIAPRSLSRSLTVRGCSVTPVEKDTRTLDPSNPAHSTQLEDLVQADLHNAIPTDEFEFRFLNDIRRREPAFLAESGDFAAHVTYDVSIEVTSDGVPLLQVEVGHSLRALTNLDEIVTPGESVKRYDVEHDPAVYDEKGTGTVTGWSDLRYTDHVDELGTTTADFHEGTLDEDLRTRLREENPRLLTIKYGSSEGTEGNQLPHVLTLTPSLSQIAEQDPQFASRFNQKKALQPGDRYRHAATFVRKLSRLPTLEVGFTPDPSTHGYQKYSFRNQYEPRLVYSDGQRGNQPRKDLPRYGVYEAPSYRVRLISPDTDPYEEVRSELPGVIAKGLADIGAPAGVTGGATYEPGETANYTKAATELDDNTDVAVIVVPQEDQAESIPQIDDPFPEMKRRLMRRGIPTQMITKKTAETLAGTDPEPSESTFANILSGIATKAGATPWMIADFPGQSDAFLGLDTSRKDGHNAGASASVVLPDGATFAAEFTTFQDGETFRPGDVTQIVRDLVFDFAADSHPSIDHVTVFRDGKIYENVDTIRDGLSDVDVTFDLAGVRKSGQPRVGHWTGTGWRIADKGVAFVDEDRERAILHSWGVPDCQEEHGTGTPRTIGIRKDSGPTDMATLTEQAYWLTEMHYGSPARSSREPIPIAFADKAAEYVREGYADPNSVIEGPAYL